VYAKLQDAPAIRWQRSAHIDGKGIVTECDAAFPVWITNEGLMGAGKRRVQLRQFLNESCEPFQRGQHLYTKNVIYYLVIRNSDYSAVKGVNVSSPFSCCRPDF